MSEWVILILLVIGAYLFGCVNNAVMLSKMKKSDIRKMGSGNPGTLNMSRTFGLKMGLLTLLLDAIKGAVPTLVGFLILKDKYVSWSSTGLSFRLSDLSMYLCGFFAVLGHIYPVFMRFKGGKGIATTIGVLLTSCICIGEPAWIVVTVMSFVAAILFIYFTEFGAMGSFIAVTPPACGATIRLFLTYGLETAYLGFYVTANVLIFGICFITWFAHRKNIERMLAGEEHPTSIKEMIIKMKAKKQEKLLKESENKK